MSEPEDTPPVIAAEPIEKPKASKRPSRKSRKYKTLKGRKAKPPSDGMWHELQVKYETGDYSQRDLCNLAKAQGYTISQAALAGRAVEQSWVKGMIRDGIRERVMAELQGKLASDLRGMLERHCNVATAIQAEAVIHLKSAAKYRETRPDFSIAPTALMTITQIIKDAQTMEARAKGWNYKEGKPFELTTEPGKEQLPELKIRNLTEEEETSLRETGSMPGR